MSRRWVFCFIFVTLGGISVVSPHGFAAIQAKPLKAEPQTQLLLDIKGKIYPKDQIPPQCPELLKGVPCPVDSFGHYEVISKKEGELIYSRAEFRDPERVQAIEESWEKDGHVKKAITLNHALKIKSELEVKGNQVIYKVTDLATGTTKTNDQELEENLVVPSTVMSYLRPQLKEIVSGKKVPLKVAVLDRMDSFTFEMKKLRDDKTASGEPVVVLQFSPTSIIVRALVSPLYFYVKLNTGEMYAFEGRSLLRKKDGEKYREMDVKTVYDYAVNQYKMSLVEQLKECEAGAMMFSPNSTPAKCEVKAK